MCAGKRWREEREDREGRKMKRVGIKEKIIVFEFHLLLLLFSLFFLVAFSFRCVCSFRCCSCLGFRSQKVREYITHDREIQEEIKISIMFGPDISFQSLVILFT